MYKLVYTRYSRYTKAGTREFTKKFNTIGELYNYIYNWEIDKDPDVSIVAIART